MILRRSFSFIFLLSLLIVGLLPTSAQGSAPFRVYLTFEDGPTDAYTPQILDLLAQYNAKATFFPNAFQIAGREEILQRVIREGHALGNHLWEEPGYYAGAEDAKVVEAYLRSETAIRAALAPTPDLLAIYDAQTKLFRQPGGGARPFPASANIPVITYNWHVDSDDCGWLIDTSTNFDQIVIDNVLNTPQTPGGLRWNVYQHGDGAIIAFHDINRVTGRVLPIILSELQAAGATFEKLPRPGDEVGTMPIALGTPPVAREGFPGVTLDGVVTTVSRIRSAPSLDADILFGSVPSETQLTLSGRMDGWYQVNYEGQTGWIANALVDVQGPVLNLPLIH
jgi:peptidoglycan/xylan/chitin deacetylase (PgdA/CDA1 family)